MIYLSYFWKKGGFWFIQPLDKYFTSGVSLRFEIIIISRPSMTGVPVTLRTILSSSLFQRKTITPRLGPHWSHSHDSPFISFSKSFLQFLLFIFSLIAVSSSKISIPQNALISTATFPSSVRPCNLKGGCRKIFFSVLGLVGHDIWWENCRNTAFRPKNGPK